MFKDVCMDMSPNNLLSIEQIYELQHHLHWYENFNYYELITTLQILFWIAQLRNHMFWSAFTIQWNKLKKEIYISSSVMIPVIRYSLKCSFPHLLFHSNAQIFAMQIKKVIYLLCNRRHLNVSARLTND